MFLKSIDARIWTSTSADSTVKRRSWSNPYHPADPYEPYDDDVEEPQIIPDIEDITNNNSSDANQQPEPGVLIDAEVTLQRANQLLRGKFKVRSLEPDGSIIEAYADNPVLNSLTYDVEFPNGEFRENAANIIAENVLTRVDDDGKPTMTFNSTLDSKKNNVRMARRINASMRSMVKREDYHTELGT